MERLKIREAIVVEGRDDVDVVNKAVDALVIATHGFGITQETWGVIDKAAGELGIIILTDPDFSGEEIRRKLTAKYPSAKQAYISREAAIKGDDIGVENASPEDVRKAILSARCNSAESEVSDITEELLYELCLVGCDGALQRREMVAKELGIGYGNGKAFVKKLKAFEITADELVKAVDKIE